MQEEQSHSCRKLTIVGTCNILYGKRERGSHFLKIASFTPAQGRAGKASGGGSFEARLSNHSDGAGTSIEGVCEDVAEIHLEEVRVVHEPPRVEDTGLVQIA